MSSQTVVPEVIQQTSEQVNEVVRSVAVPQRRNPFESAVVLSISRRWPPLSKTVSVDAIDVKGEEPGKETNKRRVHISKDLLNCAQLKRLFAHDAKVDDFLYRKCVPFPLKRAVYLLPIDLFSEVEQFLTENDEERGPLIDGVCSVYASVKEQDKQDLGPLYHDSDYLTDEAFRASFDFKWQYLQIGVSEKLKEISAEIAQREYDKMQAEYVEASAAIQSLLRNSMHDLVAHLCDRLSPDERGRKKVFRDSMLSNINEFLQTFRSRNLTDDNELASLVAQAQDLTNGISPEHLRTNDGLRDTVSRGFEEIRTKLDAMIQVAPSRQIRLAD